MRSVFKKGLTMKQLKAWMMAVVCVQMCMIGMPNISVNVIEMKQDSNMDMQVFGFCAMQKAKEVCPKGFIVRNTQKGVYPSTPDVNMVIRCNH